MLTLRFTDSVFILFFFRTQEGNLDGIFNSSHPGAKFFPALYCS